MELRELRLGWKRKIKSHSKLFEALGGKWAYDNGCWWCDDGRRFIARVQTCTHDDYCKCPIKYYLYGEEKSKIISFAAKKLKNPEINEHEITL
jgi:hypothetical protein